MGTLGPRSPGKMGTRVPILPGRWGPGSLASFPGLPVLVLRFAFSIIHGSGRARKRGRPGNEATGSPFSVKWGPGIRRMGTRENGDPGEWGPGRMGTRGPHFRGSPFSHDTGLVQIRFVRQSLPSLASGLILPYFRVKPACSFALRFMLLTQIMYNYLTWLATAQSAS